MPSLVSDYDNQLKELAEFLKSDRPDVRLECAKLIKDLSKDEAVREWVKQNKSFLVELMSMRHDKVEIVHACFSALVNLIGTSCELIDVFSADEKVLFDLLKMVVFPDAPLADLVCMLLANFSSSPKFCELLLRCSPGSESRSVEYLLDVFIKGSEGTWNPHARFDFLANVFANVTAHLESGRELFLSPRRLVVVEPMDKERSETSATHKPNSDELQLARLVCFMSHPSIVRRGGVLSTVKNVLFNSEFHHLVIGPDAKLDLLPYLLLPLAGPEELSEEDMDGLPDELQFLEDDKEREPDANLRLFLVEAVLLLTASQMGRDCLRQRKVYPIMRELDKWERDDKVKDIVFRVVNMIMRDEPSKESIGSSKLLEGGKEPTANGTLAKAEDGLEGFEEI